MSTDGTNGRRGVNWTTLFAGCGLILTVGSVVVYALIAQWTTQFSAVHDKITSERTITDLKLERERKYFEVELAKAQKQGGLHTGK